MTRRAAGAAAVVGLLLPTSAANAAPDLRQGRVAAALTVFPDDRRPDVFYYRPGELAMAAQPDGAPDLHLLHARYTGSAATGDRGRTMVRSIFSVRVMMNGPSVNQLADARSSLAGSTGRRVELRPLPIRRLDTALIYTPVAAVAPSAPAAGSDTGPGSLPAGHFEPPSSPAPRDGYWSERTYTLALAAVDAQLLADALQRGGVALSIGYAFYAEGIGPDQPLDELTGSPELVSLLQSQRESRQPAPGTPPAHLVRAGAVGVTADGARWPRLVQKADINDAAPPGYAALDVYCYDFQQGPASSLYEKQVEIEALGVGGRPVTLTVSFTRAQPDLYARSVRFPVAVRLDRPYRLRVIEIAQDGTSAATPWRERPAWSELVDVTAQGDR